MKMFEEIKNFQVKRILITYKDRLTRVGYDFLEKVFNSYG